MMLIFAGMLLAILLVPLNIYAQCPGSSLTNGLQGPSKLIQTPLGNLIVAEVGIPAPNSGRVSIVGLDGSRRSLLEGLPSGQNSIGDYAGTQGVFLSGRTLYVLNGEGNATLPGPIPGTEIPNPAPNSPIISSLLAVHLSNAAEKITNGFVLTLADHQALKDGEKLTFSNGGADTITVELIADFPDFVPEPLATFPANVRHSNPFGVVGMGNDLFIADGGRNVILKVDGPSGITSVLATFPPIPNPAPFGPPMIEAVPDSVREYRGNLLVTLLRGFPFLPGNSTVVEVNRDTGAVTPFISGLTSAIDVLLLTSQSMPRYLTLEVSVDLLADAPGRLQRFNATASPGTPISTCLIGPSSMVHDDKTGILYVTEIFTGRIIQIPGL
jgi:DNA-binding beta-propeller fold protein YncE